MAEPDSWSPNVSSETETSPMTYFQRGYSLISSNTRIPFTHTMDASAAPPVLPDAPCSSSHLDHFFSHLCSTSGILPEPKPMASLQGACLDPLAGKAFSLFTNTETD